MKLLPNIDFFVLKPNGLGAVGFIFLLAMIPATSFAVDVTEPFRNEIKYFNDSIMSPFCPGRTLGACPSVEARELRQQILSWLKDGQSITDIREQLVALYGETVFGVPAKEGFGITAWLAPIFFVLSGVLILFLWVRYGMKKNRELSQNATDSYALDPVTAAEIETTVRQRLL